MFRTGIKYNAKGRGKRRRGLLKDDRGATAVEFGMVALPFLYLLSAIMEMAAMLMSNVVLDHGAMEASRRIRTEELTASGGGASAFKTLVCNETFGMLDCAGKMFIDVQTFPNFQAANMPVPIANNQLDQAALKFQPGGPGQIVVARVYYQWDIITPFLAPIWNNTGGNARLLDSTVAFRNEG